MKPDQSDILQSTLYLIILKTLHALGLQHGFGTARRIKQIGEQVLKLDEGAVHTALSRLQQ